MPPTVNKVMPASNSFRQERGGDLLLVDPSELARRWFRLRRCRLSKAQIVHSFKGLIKVQQRSKPLFVWTQYSRLGYERFNRLYYDCTLMEPNSQYWNLWNQYHVLKLMKPISCISKSYAWVLGFISVLLTCHWKCASFSRSHLSLDLEVSFVHRSGTWKLLRFHWPEPKLHL